jgi:hypothetical protein
MRRFFFGFVWLLVFFFGEIILAGAIIGIPAANHARETAATQPKTLSEGYALGASAGHAAGYEFGKKYGTFVLWIPLILAVGGSVLGVLPGTKPKRHRADQP